MVQLSDHFSLEEFEKDGPIPAECVPAFQHLCVDVLEPTRQQFGVPFAVTSGYRDPQANTEAHGQPNSEHMATKDWCAADFFPSGSVREVFDWMRNSPALPFHQLILEHGANGSSVIHVSWNRLKPGMRSVLEGATHNAEPYVKVDCVAYAPPNNAEDVNEANDPG
jgi:hypothetical protein